MTIFNVSLIESLFNGGQYERVLELIEEEKSKTITSIYLTELHYFEMRVFERLGDWKKAWDIYLQSEKTVKDQIDNDYRLKLILLVSKTYLLWRIGKLEEGIIEVKKNMSFINKLDEKQDIDKDFSNEKWLGLYFIIISNFYLLNGELNTAWELNEKCLLYYTKINYELYIGKVLTNFGEIHLLRGEIKDSLEKYQNAVELSIKNNDPITTIESYYNLGQINYLLRKNNSALDYYQISLRLAEELQNYFYQAKINYKLMMFYYDNSEKDKVIEIVEKLSILSEQSNRNKFIDQLLMIGIALKHLSTETLKDDVQAQELLVKIYSNPVIDFDSYFSVMILLTEIFLLEYKIFNNSSILDDIDKLLQRMFNLATKNNSTRLIIETRLLQAKIDTIAGKNLEKVKKLFQQAEFNAREKNLNILLEKIQKEYQVFQNQINKWNQMIERNAPGNERLDYADIKSYIQELKRSISFEKIGSK